MKALTEKACWERLYGIPYDCHWTIVPAYGSKEQNPHTREEYKSPMRKGLVFLDNEPIKKSTDRPRKKNK